MIFLFTAELVQGFDLVIPLGYGAKEKNMDERFLALSLRMNDSLLWARTTSRLAYIYLRYLPKAPEKDTTSRREEACPVA